METLHLVHFIGLFVKSPLHPGLAGCQDQLYLFHHVTRSAVPCCLWDLSMWTLKCYQQPSWFELFSISSTALFLPSTKFVHVKSCVPLHR